MASIKNDLGCNVLWSPAERPGLLPALELLCKSKIHLKKDALDIATTSFELTPWVCSPVWRIHQNPTSDSLASGLCIWSHCYEGSQRPLLRSPHRTWQCILRNSPWIKTLQQSSQTRNTYKIPAEKTSPFWKEVLQQSGQNIHTLAFHSEDQHPKYNMCWWSAEVVFSGEMLFSVKTGKTSAVPWLQRKLTCLSEGSRSLRQGKPPTACTRTCCLWKYDTF